jgi:RHS repeat-associated protein
VIGNLTYAYDSVGRRSIVGGSLAAINLPVPIAGASYDAANELTNWNGVAMAYDANGSMVSDGLHTYSWDARHQLASIDSGGTAAFTYDPFGRRTGRIVTGVTSTGFLFDGVNPIQELTGGTPSANLIAGNTDEYFARADSSGTSSFLADALGSTIGLADASAAVQTQYTYDPFGGTSQSGASINNTFAYTGRELDVAGLYFYRARYYDPSIGRFISEDPIGFYGGPNFYAYAGNSPVNYYDPSGLVSAPSGQPPVPVPGGAEGNGWKWNANPQNPRGGSWGPQQPIPGQGQPSASEDPEGHWDVDNGLGERQRYTPDGEPITPEEAHGKCQGETPDNPISKMSDPTFMDKMSKITGLTGTALIIYLIVSEGTRLFPPRNLVPVP